MNVNNYGLNLRILRRICGGLSRMVLAGTILLEDIPSTLHKNSKTYICRESEARLLCTFRMIVRKKGYLATNFKLVLYDLQEQQERLLRKQMTRTKRSSWQNST